MGERRGAVRRCHRRVDVARKIVGSSLIETGLQQIQRSDDSGQEIVEVVRDPAGQLPDRFHLLGLKQRLLGGLQPFGCSLLRGDIAGNRIDVILVRDAGPGQLPPEILYQPSHPTARLLPERGREALELIRMRGVHIDQA